MMKFSFLLLTFLAWAAPTIAQTHAEQNAKELADLIRDFNAAFGGVVDGEMTPAQIDTYQSLVTPMLDVNAQHKYLCGLTALNSAMMASLRVSMNSPGMAEELQEITNEIVPGSLMDWMVQVSQSLILPLGMERATAVAQNECLSKPMAYVMNVDTPMDQIE